MIAELYGKCMFCFTSNFQFPRAVVLFYISTKNIAKIQSFHILTSSSQPFILLLSLSLLVLIDI